MSKTYLLGTNSATGIVLIPEWDYSFGEEISRSSFRTRNGRLFSYKWHDYNKIKFDTNWVTNSNAAIVNSWWDTQTKLIFIDITDTTATITSCMLIGKEAPFREHPEPYVEYFKGVIELEEY